MEEVSDLHLTVEAEDSGSASRQAQVLERLLLDECPSAKIRRIRTNMEAMDGGATLALALASPVLVELVKAVRDFLVQRRSTKIIVKKGKNSFTIQGAADHQITELLNFLRIDK